MKTPWPQLGAVQLMQVKDEPSEWRRQLRRNIVFGLVMISAILIAANMCLLGGEQIDVSKSRSS
jgi:hypothetical protein